ncbi:MAG: sigma-70 family RNA polymerase sigma factor [Dysgonamonadaceae bacterium]|nr:sigma-70 family RNA polymerase sigma factor [Dysgonamonadaceae bacterium]
MDIEEYKKIIVPLRPQLLSIANRITKNVADSEDVVQDVCLRIWHRREEFSKYRNVAAYCTTMTKNLSIVRIRTKHYISDETLLENHVADEPLPDRLMEEKDSATAIREIIKKLPPLQQKVFEMKDLHGYETHEIAASMGITIEAVRNNLSRARKRLRDLYLERNRKKKGDKDGY